MERERGGGGAFYRGNRPRGGGGEGRGSGRGGEGRGSGRGGEGRGIGRGGEGRGIGRGGEGRGIGRGGEGRGIGRGGEGRGSGHGGEGRGSGRGGEGRGSGGDQSLRWRPAAPVWPRPPQDEGTSAVPGGRGPGNPGSSLSPDSLATGRGMQSLALGEGKATPIKRPDSGGTACIRSLVLRVNHFPVSFNADDIIRHYDVDVKEHIVAKHARTGKISKATLAMIRDKMCKDNPDGFPLRMTAYDGEKNIFSAVELPTGPFEVEVGEGEDTRRRRYTVTIKLVSELRLRKLKEYLQGNLFLVPRDILQSMDVVMKENPTRHMISVGRTFHPVDASSNDSLRFGITSSKGFQHSLKPSIQGLALCLDYSVLAFRKRLPVLDYLQEHIPGFNVNSFRKFRHQIDTALKGLKVTVTHRTTKQKYVINRLTKEDTINITFDIEDLEGKAPPKKKKLVDYFREKYNKDILNKYIPCLDLGKNNRINYVPMEFCVLVEGQVVPKENLDRDSAMILKRVSLADARDRRKTINEMVASQDGPCGRGLIQNFGMEVKSEMTAVEGRVIEPPELKLGGGVSGRTVRVHVDRENCQWNLVGKGVVDGKPIDRWAMLDFSAASDNRTRLNVDQFVQKLIERCGKLGIYMEQPFYEPSNMRKFENNDILGEVLERFYDRARKAMKGNLQIVVCVMSWKDPGYKYLKWFSETRIGVVTQCCLSISANDARRRDQYLANLALKMNAKLGGSNVELMERPPCFQGDDHVMFIGADVNHPGSRNTTSPSIAAVVATINWPAANRYAARVCPQDHRSEKILNFGHMCWELVETYTRLNNAKPKKIVLFRDGVSEGQFDMVLNEEMLDLKRIFMSNKYHPTITVIVAQKRHQTRLFPENERDGNSRGNVPPGTVVDTTIVHPFEFDFYLCSHYGSLGTSKPTHYHVLWDEHGFTSDELQKLIYNLCFTFARCTKPVSLVPPVYYADLAAYRGRLYYEAVVGQSPPSASSSSTTLTSSSLSSMPSWDERLYKLHADLQNIMFFV